MSVHQDVAISVDSSSFRSKKTPKHNALRYEESSMASQQNQFLRAYKEAPPANNNSYAFPPINNSNYRTINASKLSERQPPSPSSTKKKSAIEQLTQKNEMLQKQVDRVQQILNRGQHRKTKRLPELDGNVLKKELQNAYKQIKSYEVDIGYRQKHYEHEGTYVDMLKKAEQTLGEREEIVKKLQAEISELKKQSNEFVKLLQDGHIKKEYANKTSRLHKEIKFFQNQLKEEEDLALSDYYNAEQKNKRIFQMEQELQSNGVDQRMIAQIKQKFVKKDKDRSAPTPANRSINSVAEDRSKKAFEDLKGEIAVLKKMQKDYAKKTAQLETEREDAQKDFQQSKGKIEQLQRQISKLQAIFSEMKRNIDPNKLKPLYKNGSLIDSSTTQFGTGKGNPLDHRFDTVQAGLYNKKHTVVNDRPAIGKKSAHIVQLTLYQNRTQFLGFEATYLIGDQLKKGNNNVIKKQNERFLKDKNVKLQAQDYFKTFECSINKQNVIIGFLAVSFKGKIIKVGPQQGFKKELDIKGKQFPCCMYGSYSTNGFEMIGIQKVESQ